MTSPIPTRPIGPAPSLVGPTAPAAVAGLAGAVVLFVFAAILSFSAGLVVVALFIGRVVGLAARSGGAGVEGATRTSIAVLVTLASITVGLLATWGASRLGGGSLGPVDFLLQTLGPVVPLQYIAGTLAAWWSSR